MGEEDLTGSKRADYLARESATLFASVMDGFFQEYIKAVADGDDRKLTFTAVALWQTSVSITAFFKDLATMGLSANGYKDQEQCQALASKVAKLFREKMLAIGQSGKEIETEKPEPVTLPIPDRNLN